jgi:hypothetical protein
MEKGRNPTVGTLAHLGQVDIRIAAKGEDAANAEALIEPAETEIRRRLGDLIFGADGDTLESRIAEGLARTGWSVAVAELGSGGLVSERPGAGVPEVLLRSPLARATRLDRRRRALARGRHDAAQSLAEAIGAGRGRGRSGVLLRDIDGSTPPVTLRGHRRRAGAPDARSTASGGAGRACDTRGDAGTDLLPAL